MAMMNEIVASIIICTAGIVRKSMLPNSRLACCLIYSSISALSLVSIGCSETQQHDDETTGMNIHANSAFFYYDDLDGAVHFYQDVLGFQCVLDYGVAKIFQTSQTSYIGVVKGGMHSTDEPKSVTLAFVVDDVDAWYSYLTEEGVPIQSNIETATQHPTRSFTALDPEGYHVQFEMFLDQAPNRVILDYLGTTKAWYPPRELESSRPANLAVRGSIFWLYYEDLAGAQQFYEDALGLELLVDQEIPKIYSSSPTGFIGLNDAKISSHSATEEKAVNLSFFTDDADAWLRHLQAKGVRLRSEEIFVESDAVRVCIAYDPEGYFLEFDAFLDTEENKDIIDSFLEGHQEP
jgi:lactoylglutathione lyase